MSLAHLTAGLLLALGQSSGEPQALGDAELLRRAEAAFRAGAAQRADPEKARQAFAEAAHHYGLLRQRGADNADLYRNAGNAHLLAGELPEAILAYRRGLRCAPHDAELRANLEYARDQVLYVGPEGRGRPLADDWPSWMPPLDRGLFLMAAFLLYALACVSAVRGLLAGRDTGLGQAAVLLALAVAAGGLWTYLTWRVSRDAGQPVMVVSAEEVPLWRGNGPTHEMHKTMPHLHRGMEGRLLHRRGGWLQVRLPGGEIGWLPQTAALVDGP